jgi:hypothetical protein
LFVESSGRASPLKGTPIKIINSELNNKIYNFGCCSKCSIEGGSYLAEPVSTTSEAGWIGDDTDEFKPTIWFSNVGLMMNEPLPITAVTGCLDFFNKTCLPGPADNHSEGEYAIKKSSYSDERDPHKYTAPTRYTNSIKKKKITLTSIPTTNI